MLPWPVRPVLARAQALMLPPLALSIFFLAAASTAAEFPSATVADTAGVNTGVNTKSLDDQDLLKI